MISPAHQRLRDATRDDHERLESRLDILRRISDVADRGPLVRAFLGFHAAMEAAVAPWLADLPGLAFEARRRTPVLQRDLQDLGLAPGAPQAGVPAPDSLGEALGLMYVLEGSTLGGRVIRREVAARGGEFKGLGFLDPYGEEAGAQWRAFLAILDRHTAVPDAEAASITGARAGFRHAERLLCEETALV